MAPLLALLLASCSGSRAPVAPPLKSIASAPSAPAAILTPAAPEDAGAAVAPARATRVGAVDDADAMILDDANVYLLASDVQSLPKSGGDTTNLTEKSAMRYAGNMAPGESPRLAQSGGRIFITNTFKIQQPSTPEAVVYWTVDSTIATAFKNGDAPVFLKTGNIEVRGVATDAQWVYWLQSGAVSRVRSEDLPTDRLVKMPIAGGKPTVVATNLGDAVEFAVDATFAYVATITTGHKGRVLRLPITGDASTAIAVDEVWPDEQTTLALDASHVYWTVGDRLVRLDKSAPARSTPSDVVKGFDAVSTGSSRAYTIDDTHVYWTSPTAVMRAEKDGSAPPERIATGKRLGAIAVDATDVFYVSADSMSEYSLMRLPK